MIKCSFYVSLLLLKYSTPLSSSGYLHLLFFTFFYFSSLVFTFLHFSSLFFTFLHFFSRSSSSSSYTSSACSFSLPSIQFVLTMQIVPVVWLCDGNCQYFPVLPNSLLGSLFHFAIYYSENWLEDTQIKTHVQEDNKSRQNAHDLSTHPLTNK